MYIKRSGNGIKSAFHPPYAFRVRSPVPGPLCTAISGPTKPAAAAAKYYIIIAYSRADSFDRFIFCFCFFLGVEAKRVPPPPPRGPATLFNTYIYIYYNAHARVETDGIFSKRPVRHSTRIMYVLYANAHIRISILINTGVYYGRRHARACVYILYYRIVYARVLRKAENCPARKSLLYFRNFNRVAPRVLLYVPHIYIHTYFLPLR